MLRNLVTILAILCSGYSSESDEAVVETVSDYGKTDYNSHSSESRNGRLYYTYQNPMLNIAIQATAPNFVGHKQEDVFDFLRDSYPLPGGELI